MNRDQITVAPDFKPPEEQPVWRQDFPIDWPEDQYVERRAFLRFMVLISGAFAAGQVWILAHRLFRSWQPPAAGVLLGSLDTLPIGGSLAFRYPTENDPCLLVRTSETEVNAFSQKCTHLSCAVIPRPAENIFLCPCHEGRFDIRSGAPLAGPPRRPLPRVVLETRGREIYAVRMDPEVG
jgi:Rieske Fe-S protein